MTLDVVAVPIQDDVGDAAGVIDMSVQADLLTCPIAVNLNEILGQETAITIGLSHTPGYPIFLVYLT